MITWTVGLTARPGRENSFIAIANELTETSNRLDEGCDIYICLQNLADPRDFLWYEQWATMPLLERHVERIRPMLAGGPEGPGGSRLNTAIQRREQLGYHLLRNHVDPARDWHAASITAWAVARAKPGTGGGAARTGGGAEPQRSGAGGVQHAHRAPARGRPGGRLLV